MKLLDVLNAPWAIMPAKKIEIDEIYATHLRGEKIDIKAIEASLGRTLDNQPVGYDIVDGVAVIDIEGVVAKRANFFMQISGGVSTQMLADTFRQALADPNVNAILMVIDSPGGAVDGTEELANAIYAARGTKPIVAVADGVMASAAYWFGSSADKVFAASETTQVGSIGVVATHRDVSGAEAQRGVKTTEITSGKYKRVASSYGALSQEGRQNIQDQTDYIYGVFVDAVARNRGAASAEAVHETMADGRLFFGQQAVDAGLVDGVATVDDVLARLAAGEFADLPSAIPTGARAAVPAAAEKIPRAVAGDASLIPTTMETTMDKKQFLAEHPAIAAEIRAEGRAEGVTEGEKKGADQGRADGATAERARIESVFAQTMPGHETLVKSLAFDGKTTGPEAAVQILNAEREKKVKIATDLRTDAPAAAPHAPTAEIEKPAATTTKDVDHAAVAKKAQQYQAEELKKGNTVSAADAVAHVTAQEAK